MNKCFKFLSIVLALALSFSVLAFSACKDNSQNSDNESGKHENENMPDNNREENESHETINLEELFDYAELFMNSENWSGEFKSTADFSGDLDKLNLMEGIAQNFFVGIKKHEFEQIFDLKYLDSQSEIYADYFASMGTYQTNLQGECITLADSEANASRILYLGQDCYEYENSSGTFVKYGSRSTTIDSYDDIDNYETAIPSVPHLLIQSLILQMLVIIDYNVNGNIELSKQFIMDKLYVDVTEDPELMLPKSLTEMFNTFFGISTEELKEEIKVNLTGSELIITVSATCNHTAQSAGDGNYNLYYEIEGKFNYAAGLTTEYFESLIS